MVAPDGEFIMNAKSLLRDIHRLQVILFIQMQNSVPHLFLTVSRNRYLLISAFIAYVRSLLEYCCSVWSPSKLGLIDKLENIQRRFTKRLHGLQHLSYNKRLQLLKIYSLECRRIKADLIMFFEMFHQLINLEVHTFFDISNSKATTLKLNVVA